MKAFWIMIAALAVLTVAICLPNRNSEKRLVPGQRTVSNLASPNTPIQAIQDAPPTKSTALATTRTADGLAIEPAKATPQPSPAPSQPNSQIQPDDDMKALAADLIGSYDARPDTEKGDLNAELGAGLPPPPPASKPDSKQATTKKDGPPDVKIEHKPDGSLLLDDRFVVRGAGTEKDPYRITWELLVSAEATYAPHQDMFEMPSRISFLNGKHIRISGFLFTATYRAGTSELLVMRNMWDGCCIGKPPTSYDAIEVSLKQPLTSEDLAIANFGTLDGVLKVDPFVKDSWLLGLYVVENGRVYVGDF